MVPAFDVARTLCARLRKLGDLRDLSATSEKTDSEDVEDITWRKINAQNRRDAPNGDKRSGI